MMPIDPELLDDFYALARAHGVLTEEDLEVFRLTIQGDPEKKSRAFHDFIAKAVLRIRAKNGTPTPIGGGPKMFVGEIWKWYVENGGKNATRQPFGMERV